MVFEKVYNVFGKVSNEYGKECNVKKVRNAPTKSSQRSPQ